MGLPPYGVSPASVPEGFQRASGKPTVSINVRQLCRKETDSGGLTRRLRGIDAPTPARTVGLPPRRGQYFLSKRKKVPKKARGTATPEAARPAARRGLRSAGALRAVLDLGSLRSPAGKKASIAHFDGGARNVARNIVGELIPTFVRARARLFPLSKWASLFPSAAYRRSAPPQVAWGKLKWRCLGCCSVAGRLRSAEKQDYFFLCCWH